MRSSPHQVDLLEQSESLYLVALPYCSLDYTRLVLHHRCVSCEPQYVRGQRCVHLYKLLECLACSTVGSSNASFSAASWLNCSCLKNAHQQTLKEVRGGAYKPSERASCSSSKRTCASFCARFVVLSSRSYAGMNRISLSIDAWSSAMSACTRNANTSMLDNVAAPAPETAPQAIRQYCSPAWKKTRLPARGTPDGPRVPSCVCVFSRVWRAHALARILGHVCQLQDAYLHARHQSPRVHHRACLLVVLCAPRT